ncbi:MAG TPA: Fic family protein [Gammaproteobacteria bacterium]|jgi:Fic family protein|nr:Fic family protein [Gammaproteobacteria bacterium]
MDPKDFRCAAAGRVVRTPEGVHAFVPAALPPALSYDAALTLALSRADAALSGLAGLDGMLPNPHLLITPYVRREAVLSSRIEGTRASLSDLLLDEAEADVPHGDAADVREVRNYVSALEFGVRRLKQLPLSLRLVRELHARLMRGVRGGHVTPGEFRRSQNWIGPAGSTLATATYVPPPPAEMRQALNAWENFINQRDQMPDLIQCALMHEHFEAIHPFLDGNGRVGRLLITLFLMERGRLPQPALYLSAFIEQHRRDYYDLLLGVRTHCEWIAWLRYFLRGVEETAQDAVVRARRLVALREKFRSRLAGKARALALLDQLYINPYITVARAERLLHVSNPTARQAIGLLEKHGLLKEISGRSWGKLYCAKPILDAVERPLAKN